MLVMHSINVVRRNRRLQTCGDFHHYYSLEEPQTSLQSLWSKREQLWFLTISASPCLRRQRAVQRCFGCAPWQTDHLADQLALQHQYALLVGLKFAFAKDRGGGNADAEEFRPSISVLQCN